MSSKGYRGYIFSRPFQQNRVPQHIQNLVIREFCKKEGVTFLLSATEYAMQDCYMMLEQISKDMSDIDGIVAYSLFQMPVSQKHRKVVYDRIIEANKVLGFAVEGFLVKSVEDVERVEKIRMVQDAIVSSSEAAFATLTNHK